MAKRSMSYNGIFEYTLKWCTAGLLPCINVGIKHQSAERKEDEGCSYERYSDLPFFIPDTIPSLSGALIKGMFQVIEWKFLTMSNHGPMS